LNEEHDKRNQANALVARFKRTGLAPPIQEWVPQPTAGDHARQITNEIIEERDAELPTVEEASKEFFNGKSV
jgi:hypothetical protein